jgi:hypothetical protein
MIKKFFLLFFLIVGFTTHSQVKILFDATKAQMAGSADWVIDAEAHNLYTSNPTSGITVNTGGTESNPQRIPLPAQSGITSATLETYWQGAISHWAIDCVRQGYTVESLPWNARITYGDLSNSQDLSNYKVFIVDEPNILFSAIEKNAIVNFVKNGGGLMMIADHTISDRNNDNYDSLMVWNDLMTTNTVLNNPFGISFDAIDFSQTSSNVANIPNSTILHGPASPIVCAVCGNVTQVKWSGGTTMTLSPNVNPSVTGLVYKIGSSTTGNLNVMCASATYFAGKVIAIGDSSIPDDSTGDPNDILYDGYIADASGNHQKLLMNATIWLATNSTMGSATFDVIQENFTIAPNPISGKELKLFYKTSTMNPLIFSIYDSIGREVKKALLTPTTNTTPQNIDCSDLISGLYFGKIQTEYSSKTIRFSVK